MAGVGALAKLPSHKIGKFVTLALWVVALAVLAPLAQKLTSVQDNQQSSWLPSDAESTKVLDITKQFRSSDEIPAVVVYEKPGGLTQGDLIWLGDQAKQFKGVEKVDGQVVGPIPSGEQPQPQAAQLVVPINVGSAGWDKLGEIVDKIKDIAKNDRGMSVHVTG